MGVQVAVQRETQRSRQIEFLAATANPIDMQIVGLKGRAAVLRNVSSTLGMDGDEVVPSEEELEQKEQAQAAQAEAQAKMAAVAQGSQQGAPSTGDMGPRTNLQQQAPKPTISGGVH